MSPPPENDEGTRGERRESKHRKKKHALRMHGASLRRVYRDAILKRAKRRGRLRGKPTSDESESS
jgi:hypothetical protein